MSMRFHCSLPILFFMILVFRGIFRVAESPEDWLQTTSHASPWSMRALLSSMA